MSEDDSIADTSRGWRLINTKDFGLLWWGQTTSQIGEELNKVALLWFVYELTGSAMKMTMVGLRQTIPPLLFGPALVSAVPLLVRPSELMSANALIQGTNNIGMLLGPAISGILIAIIDAENVLFVNSATFLLSALCLIPIHVTAPLARPKDLSTSIWQELTVGFRFIFGQQSMVLTLVIISSLYNLGVSAFVFILPVYAKEFLQVGPVQLGWLWSALGVGMLAASTWLAWNKHSDRQGRLRIVVSGMTIGGLAVCSLSLLETPLIAAGIVIIVGGSTAVLNPIIWALLQEVTPEHLIGRVVTTFSVGSMASAMAGMTGFGWVADAVGPAASLIGLGLVLLLTAAVAVACVRRTYPVPVAHA